MTTGTVKGRGKPKGFRIIPEGETTLHVTNVEGKPRTNIRIVEMNMHDKDGVSLTGPRKQTYNLDSDGGYAALYHLMVSGYGIDLATDEVNLADIEDTYVRVRIVHKEGKQPREDGTVAVFSNIAETLGPGEPFDAISDDESASDDASEESWD